MLKKVELKGTEGLKRQIGAMIARGEHLEPLFRQISEIMHAEVMENFAQHGRDPKWQELAPSTKKRYAKKGYALEPTLDRRSAGLVSSIQTFVTDTSAGVDTNKKYAAIHNFGGDIVRKPHSRTVRLRTDAKGNLLRQGAEGLKANLAVFAKSGHKRTRDYFRFSMGYTIRMPRREFMKVSPAGLGDIEAAAARFISGG